MNTKRLKQIAVFVLLAATNLSCIGQSVTYTSRNAFDAAIVSLSGSRQDVNFEGDLPPGGIDQGGGIVRYASPWTAYEMTFQGEVLLLRNTANGRILNNYDSLQPLMVQMNGASLAFGADFASLLSPVHSSFSATVSLNNGEVFTFTAPSNPNLVFFGFVTAQPFSSLTFSDGGLISGSLHEEIIDNITVVVVPEPRVLSLFVIGILLLYWRLTQVRQLELFQRTGLNSRH